MKETGFLLFSFDACLQLRLKLVLSLDTRLLSYCTCNQQHPDKRRGQWGVGGWSKRGGWWEEEEKRGAETKMREGLQAQGDGLSRDLVYILGLTH